VVISSEESALSDAPQVTRIRHEIRRRLLDVAHVERIAPQMVRIVLTGQALEGFTSLGFDDHVKLFFPGEATATEPAASAARDFTPRRHDPARGELWIDFFLHDAGPATQWAGQARAGDTLEVGGPKGSVILATEGVDLQVMVGDETAFPAIARRLEELPGTARVLVVAEAQDPTGWPDFTSAARSEVIWVPRGASAGPAAALVERLRDVQLPAERCYVWAALESQAARAVRRHFIERGITKEWIKASAYWQRGGVGKHERIED
jgi:NADPH-dependent ferric siderophore reductase